MLIIDRCPQACLDARVIGGKGYRQWRGSGQVDFACSVERDNGPPAILYD